MQSENEQKVVPSRKRGIAIMGYFIPAWVIVVILIAVAIYVANERGALPIFKKIDALSLKGPVASLSPVSVDSEVKRLFNGYV